MQYRKGHPWDPRLALPQNVKDEPPVRGTITSKYMARRTIDAPWLAPPWKPGYAYPAYLRREPLGRGVIRTKYLPRKTVSLLVPKMLDGISPATTGLMATAILAAPFLLWGGLGAAAYGVLKKDKRVRNTGLISAAVGFALPMAAVGVAAAKLQEAAK